MNKQQLAYFCELPVRTHYVSNGNRCIKQSSRTFYLPAFGRWFYASQRELCLVGLHSRLAADYFEAQSQ